MSSYGGISRMHGINETKRENFAQKTNEPNQVKRIFNCVASCEWVGACKWLASLMPIVNTNACDVNYKKAEIAHFKFNNKTRKAKLTSTTPFFSLLLQTFNVLLHFAFSFSHCLLFSLVSVHMRLPRWRFVFLHPSMQSTAMHRNEPFARARRR